MSSKGVCVLMSGLDFEWMTQNFPDMIVDTSALQKTFKEAQNTPGLYVEAYFLKPDDPASIDGYGQKLRIGTSDGRPWDGALLGQGVRCEPALTTTFEKLVNLVKELAPHAKLCFNGTMTDHVEVVRRNFSQLQKV